MCFLPFFHMQNIKPGSTVPTTAKRQLHHRLYFHFTCRPPIRSHLLHNHSCMSSSKKSPPTVPSLFQLPCHYLFYFIMHTTSHEVCDGKILLYIPYQGFAHQDITNPPNIHHVRPTGKRLESTQNHPKFRNGRTTESLRRIQHRISQSNSDHPRTSPSH